MQILVMSDENQGNYIISRPVKSILQYRNVSPVCTADSRDGAPGSGSRSPRRPRRGCGWSDGPPAAGPTGAEPHGQRPGVGGVRRGRILPPKQCIRASARRGTACGGGTAVPGTFLRIPAVADPGGVPGAGSARVVTRPTVDRVEGRRLSRGPRHENWPERKQAVN